jgi:thioredoxin-like negative regulator of GroEL
LEASLALEPRDVFLRYALALQCLRDGDLKEGRERLVALIHDEPDYVAAYQQLGQSYLESGEAEPARQVLESGRQKALERGESHAAAEMSGLLAVLE